MNRHTTQKQKTVNRRLGETVVSRSTAWVLSAFMLVSLLIVPTTQCVLNMLSDGPEGEAAMSRPTTARRSPALQAERWWQALFQRNRSLLKTMNTFEDRLEEDSWLRKAILPATQNLMTRFLGVGNEQAICGLDGWLFFQPDVKLVTGPGFLDPRQLQRRAHSGEEWEQRPQPDPFPAILDFRDQLTKRGIELVVVPIPVKPTIVADQLGGSLVEHIPLNNPSYDAFVRQLERQGVLVCDSSPVIARVRALQGGYKYLKTDTHWTPGAMELVAFDTARLVGNNVALQDRPATDYVVASETVTNHGDLAMMVMPEHTDAVFGKETVTVHQVLTPRRETWRATKDADVLVLGDSFSNIYSLKPMGWGFSGGFVEHLSRYLKRPVDRIIRNDAGAYATREMLSRELARGHDRLAGKRVVVWQFAARELAFGDWRFIDMELGVPSSGQFLELKDEQIVTGTVEAVSAVPKPGSVPYRDYIMAVHLRDLEGLDATEALVYMWGMRDNAWAENAFMRAGQQVTMRLSPWDDVAGEYERLNRGELEDDRFWLATPCWGETVGTE